MSLKTLVGSGSGAGSGSGIKNKIRILIRIWNKSFRIRNPDVKDRTPGSGAFSIQDPFYSKSFTNK